jgi:hypothetical protein
MGRVPILVVEATARLTTPARSTSLGRDLRSQFISLALRLIGGKAYDAAKPMTMTAWIEIWPNAMASR